MDILINKRSATERLIIAKTLLESVLQDMSTEIIYCGECAHMMPDGRCRQFADSSIFPSASDFCSAAERREDD